MIQDIYPDYYDPEFKNITIKEDDYLLSYKGNGILAVRENNTVYLPKLSDYKDLVGDKYESIKSEAYYLFAISEKPYFLCTLKSEVLENIDLYKTYNEAIENTDADNKCWFYLSIHEFRELNPIVMVFAGATGFHIRNWAESKRFCGYCGSKTRPSEEERAFICCECGQIEYPKISPAVIVAIKNDDKLLLVRNKRGAYKKLALVSGFVEIGESFEQTVHREVLEETGLKVKNVKRYKDQPWGISGAHMIGFTAEVDGDHTIKLQESELSEGKWYKKEEIPEYRNRLSVGSEMIQMFTEGKL